VRLLIASVHVTVVAIPPTHVELFAGSSSVLPKVTAALAGDALAAKSKATVVAVNAATHLPATNPA